MHVPTQEKVLLDAHGGENLAALGHLGDAHQHPFAGRQVIDAFSVEQDLSLLRRQQSGDGLDQRRLAGTVGTDQRDDLAGAHRQIDVLHYRSAVVSGAEAAHLKH